MENLKNFDNNLKKTKDRVEHLNKVFAENEDLLASYISNTMLIGDERTETKPVNQIIERLGTYLIRAEDNQSCRIGEYSFFETEADYRKVNIGKHSISTDIEQRDDLDILKTEQSEFKSDEIDVYKLFNFETMSPDEKKKLIKLGLRDKDDYCSNLQEIMQSCYEYIIDMLEDEKDRMIVDLTIEGKTEVEIAEILSIARQNVNKRMKRICESKI